MSRRYTVTYEVPAETEYVAIHEAVRMLREEVRLLSTSSAVELAPGWWKVTLRVSEDS